jgi:hypothetical protein
MAERKGFSFGLYLQVANDARVDVRATLNVHKLDDWILASARDRPSIRTDEWQRLRVVGFIRSRQNQESFQKG